MKRLIDYIRGSFSARLSIWVVLFVALIFLASQTYVSAVGRRSLREEAVRTADQVLDNTNLRLETIIEDVESAADNLEWLVYRHLDSPETLLEYSRTTVQGNPFLSGCSISLEPYFFKGMKYFSAYSSNTDGVVETSQEGDEDYEYFYLDWYLMPKLLNQPCWTEPYCDWEYGDDYSLQTEMLISYSKPLTANDGTFIGVISLDISLKWLSETLSDIKPYPNSYSILISRGGTFLVHPDPEKLFYQTIFTNLLIKDDPTFDRIGRKVINGGEGMEEVKLNGTDSFMFFKPVKSTGWSLAIVCPQRDIFGSFNRLRWIFDLILLLSLFLLFLTCFNVIRRTVKPLSDLSAEAESIAEGDFNRPLPLVERIDEIGTLSRSFSHMQSSLVSYIDELKETTAKKERIEGELRIAHDIQMGMVPNVFPAFPEEEDQAHRFTRLQRQMLHQAAAVVPAFFKAPFASSFSDRLRIPFRAIGTDETVPQAIEPVRFKIRCKELIAVFFIEQIVFDHAVSITASGGIKAHLEVSVIHIHMVKAELEVREHRERACPAAVVSQTQIPDFNRIIHCDKERLLGSNAAVVTAVFTVTQSVAAGVVLLRLPHRLPGDRPVIPVLIVTQVQIVTGSVHRNAVGPEAGNAVIL